MMPMRGCGSRNREEYFCDECRDVYVDMMVSEAELLKGKNLTYASGQAEDRYCPDSLELKPDRQRLGIFMHGWRIC